MPTCDAENTRMEQGPCRHLLILWSSSGLSVIHVTNSVGIISISWFFINTGEIIMTILPHHFSPCTICLYLFCYRILTSQHPPSFSLQTFQYGMYQTPQSHENWKGYAHWCNGSIWARLYNLKIIFHHFVQIEVICMEDVTHRQYERLDINLG